jgi:hypothetical protein
LPTGVFAKETTLGDVAPELQKEVSKQAVRFIIRKSIVDIDMCFADQNLRIEVKIHVTRTWPRPAPAGRATAGELIYDVPLIRTFTELGMDTAALMELLK